MVVKNSVVVISTFLFLGPVVFFMSLVIYSGHDVLDEAAWLKPMSQVTLTHVTISPDGKVNGSVGAQQYELIVKKTPVVKHGKTKLYVAGPKGYGYTTKSDVVKYVDNPITKHQNTLSFYATVIKISGVITLALVGCLGLALLTSLV